MKRAFCLLLCIVTVLALAGCFQSESDMPFNGEVTFHGLKLTVPEDFIRDSTQSTEDIWLFEKGWYKKTIVLLHRQLQEDPNAYLTAYATGMEGQGVAVTQVSFLDTAAVKCAATKEDGTYWQELSFIHNGAFYAIAMNGATEADFDAFLQSVSFG